MRESLMYGSVRGARGNSRPYRDDRSFKNQDRYTLPCCVAPNSRSKRSIRVISLGDDRGRGPVYVRSTSDRVEILCTGSERRQVPTTDMWPVVRERGFCLRDLR